MKNRSILIGLDGATFHLLDPLMQDGTMPFLKEFVESGVRGNLLSVIPPLTPPAWTSLMTGVNPGNHGIFDFFQKEKGGLHIRFTTHHDVRSETIWSIADRQNAKITTLNFPLMMPPPEINGYVISGGWMTWRQIRLGCHPEDLYERVKALPGFNARELAMDMSHEEKALEGCRLDEYEEWIRMHIGREEQWMNILKYLMRKDPCELTAILFDGVDKIQHLCWRFLSPKYLNGDMSVQEQRIRNLCLEYFSKLDRILLEINELAGPDARIIMASDHGFGAQTQTFFVNSWLAQNGYLSWAKKGKSKENRSGGLGMSQLSKHVYMIDWEKTLAYASTPSSNGIHIVMEDKDHKNGVALTEYKQFRDELVEKLYGVTNPVTGKAVVSRVWTREEAFNGPYTELAPDLTMILGDGGLISILNSDEPVRQRDETAGTHRMEGVIMARGPGVCQGKSVDAVSILDVAPLILYTLGMEIPKQMEGRMPSEIFEVSYLQANPVKDSGDFEIRESVHWEESERMVYDEEAEAAMAERLRALGYIE
ncbi:alkaline phosphatase family protein [Desulfobacula sp.]|uniref:alkaline phosphatase family protein n=1 Tax=Desulfobacula sp. TaxID=2593537 RepID=UPI00263112C5|nr:alkaline phosphatase family protein [Desulfobacula sp.]